MRPLMRSLVLVVLVLAGLLSMHGLTTNHRPAPGMGTETPGMSHASHVGVLVTKQISTWAAASALDPMARAADGQSQGHGDDGLMMACLAVLLGTASIVLILALVLRRRTPAYFMLVRLMRTAAGPRPPPLLWHLTPRLSVLCISRT